MSDTDAYRTLIRRNYAISLALRTERDLDARFALRDEQRVNREAAHRSPLSEQEKAVIANEEFARAYPTLRTGVRQAGASDKGRWSRRAAALS